MNEDTNPNDVSVPLTGLAVEVKFQPIGTVAEQNSADGAGRRVDYRPAGGGRSISETSVGGSYLADLSGPLPKGKSAEPHARKVLIAALEAAGHRVEVVPPNEDDDARGKDGVLRIDGKVYDVQLVTLPAAGDVWKELSSKGSAATAGDLADAVQLARLSVEKKKDWWRGYILALDASNLGALSCPTLVDAYLALHGDPNTEFGFAQTWIVGPTVGSTFKVG